MLASCRVEDALPARRRASGTMADTHATIVVLFETCVGPRLRAGLSGETWRGRFSSLPLCRRLAFGTYEGGGRNAAGLARPSRRPTRPPTGELSPMAFPGGGVCRIRDPSPPPDASSDLDRLLAHAVSSATADLNRGRMALPPLHDEGSPSSQGEATSRPLSRHTSSRGAKTESATRSRPAGNRFPRQCCAFAGMTLHLRRSSRALRVEITAPLQPPGTAGRARRRSRTPGPRGRRSRARR